MFYRGLKIWLYGERGCLKFWGIITRVTIWGIDRLENWTAQIQLDICLVEFENFSRLMDY